SPPQNVTNEDQHAQDHDQRVVLNVSGLDETYGPAHGLYETAKESDQPVDDPSIPPTGTNSALHCPPCRAVYRTIHYLRIEFPQTRSGAFGAIDEQGIVEFIDVPLVQQKRVRRTVLPNLTLFVPTALAVFEVSETEPNQCDGHRNRCHPG